MIIITHDYYQIMAYDNDSALKEFRNFLEKCLLYQNLTRKGNQFSVSMSRVHAHFVTRSFYYNWLTFVFLKNRFCIHPKIV